MIKEDNDETDSQSSVAEIVKSGDCETKTKEAPDSEADTKNGRPVVKNNTATTANKDVTTGVEVKVRSKLGQRSSASSTKSRVVTRPVNKQRNNDVRSFQAAHFKSKPKPSVKDYDTKVDAGPAKVTFEESMKCTLEMSSHLLNQTAILKEHVDFVTMAERRQSLQAKV